MSLKDLRVPEWGQRIGWDGKAIQVPDKPIIPYMEDGTGPDIWRRRGASGCGH
jgi:isocitrate dehydrogenase